MATPVISWWKQDNLSQWTLWDIGTVDADNTSKNDIFLIWNNRGGSTDVPDAEGCMITTKDITGGNNGEIITEKWIEVKCDTMNESTFTPIGGDTAKAIKAGGNAPAGIIKGTANDGTIANSASNFAQVTAHAHPSVTATAGVVDFLLRVFYTYQ